ncbi:MAG TPA: hypothetical protein DDX54_06075 [Rhodospirillaceae bacterium]|jgi:hypothetical protein|nr:hypothetical protein [Alphaproteobacteria bacterium]HBH26952.1 hypothetical protein [Rhodospirillaceae bacterium]
MTGEQRYLDAAVAEALAQSGGSAAAARRVLLARVRLDLRLLQAMVGPHMGGIVGYHVERVLRRATSKARASAAPPPAASEPPPAEVPPAQFAADLLAAITSDSGAPFGLGADAQPPARRPAASPAHAEALRRLAAARRGRGAA